MNIFQKKRIKYTKLRDWISVITLLYEKTLKQSRIDKKIDEQEALDLKTIVNHYLDKRKETMKNTNLKVEVFFGDIISKDNISSEQTKKSNNFLAKMM